MDRKLTRILVILIIFILGFVSSAGDQYLDVLHLKDGISITGVIVEQTPGESMMLETSEGELLTFGFDDVARIEKVQVQEAGAEYKDVISLKDGVIFKGIIRE